MWGCAALAAEHMPDHECAGGCFDDISLWDSAKDPLPVWFLSKCVERSARNSQEGQRDEGDCPPRTTGKARHQLEEEPSARGPLPCPQKRISHPSKPRPLPGLHLGGKEQGLPTELSSSLDQNGPSGNQGVFVSHREVWRQAELGLL